MTIQSLIEYIDALPFSEVMRSHETLFPWVESVHVLAITCVVGVITLVDLRLIGWSMRELPASRLLKQTLPLVWGAFAIALVTGSMMFMAHAVDYSANVYIYGKFSLLALAGLNMIGFHFIGQKRIAEWDMAATPAIAARIAGGLSILLWIGVIIFGRWIAYIE
jgi:hypothetical protein